MPRRLQKSAAKSVRRTLKGIQRSSSVKKPVLRRKAGLTNTRASNLNRINRREIKRQVKKTNPLNRNRVRPAVRPVAAPRRVMPKRKAPSVLSSVQTRRAANASRLTRAKSSFRSGGRPRPATRLQQKSSARPSTQTKRSHARPASIMTRAVAAGTAGAAAAFVLNVASAHPQISSEVSSLQYSLTNLQDLSSFEDLEDDLNRLERDLTHALDLLESARDKGYRYQKDLDEIALDVMDRWQEVYQKALDEIDRQSGAFRGYLTPLGDQVQRLNTRLSNPMAAESYLSSTETMVNGLLSDVNGIRRNIESQYHEIKSQTSLLNSRLSTIHWVLNQLEEARFQLDGQEDIVKAVPARWDQEGDDDPEGILYLTSKRLIFERKEKVATKKVLFITTATELVQEVIIREAVSEIKSAKAVNKGLFGHQDFLEVQFTKLGSIPFHLDGQDSDDWASLVGKVQSGRIQDDRTMGSSLSFAELTGEISQADIAEIQGEVNDLQDELMLKESRADLEELENEVRSLERDLGDLRARGYAIESDLEAEISILVAQWLRVKENAEKTLTHQADLLASQMANIQDSMSRLAGLSGNPGAARPVFMQLKSLLASAEAQAEAARDTVFSQYDDYADEIEGLSAHLDWLDWMLDALATASFQLLATESGVAATEAIWTSSNDEQENGILFLTDQRLLWEDRAGNYELRVDIPLTQVLESKFEVRDEDAELLIFSLDSAAPFRSVRFELASPVAEEWLKMIGRAKSGDYTRDRAIEIDEAAIERVKNAPTNCPNCSAAFTAPILRGQTEVTCEFCGTITRI